MNKQESIVPSESQEPYKALVADIGRELYGDPHVDLLSALNEEPDFGKLTQALEISWGRRLEITMPHVKRTAQAMLDGLNEIQPPKLEPVLAKHRRENPEVRLINGPIAELTNLCTASAEHRGNLMVYQSIAIGGGREVSNFIRLMKFFDPFAELVLQQMGSDIAKQSSFEVLVQLQETRNEYFTHNLIKRNMGEIQRKLSTSSSYPEEGVGSGVLARSIMSAINSKFLGMSHYSDEQEFSQKFVQNIQPGVLIGLFKNLYRLDQHDRLSDIPLVFLRLFCLKITDSVGFGHYYGPEDVVMLAKAHPGVTHLFFGDQDLPKLSTDQLRDMLSSTQNVRQAVGFLNVGVESGVISVADFKYIIDGNAEAEARMKGRWLEIYTNAALKAVTDLFSRQKTA